MTVPFQSRNNSYTGETENKTPTPFTLRCEQSVANQIKFISNKYKTLHSTFFYVNKELGKLNGASNLSTRCWLFSCFRCQTEKKKNNAASACEDKVFFSSPERLPGALVHQSSYSRLTKIGETLM